MSQSDDGGRWLGDWTGSIAANGLHIVEGALDGSGEHNGLRFVARWERTDWPGAKR